jgi:hypothetical protein
LSLCNRLRNNWIEFVRRNIYFLTALFPDIYVNHVRHISIVVDRILPDAIRRHKKYFIVSATFSLT